MTQDNMAMIVAMPEYSREEIEALKDTIKASNRDMTDAQFTVFMAAARHLGLDALARQVVPIFQAGRMTVQTTIDGFRLIAKRTGAYRGQLGPFWCGSDGEWRDVWLADGAPTAAKVGVKCSDLDEIMWGVARYKSYAKGGNWNTMPDVMLAKVAESLALRKAFPAELSGAYIREEMEQSETLDDPQPTPPAPPKMPTPIKRQAPAPVVQVYAVPSEPENDDGDEAEHSDEYDPTSDSNLTRLLLDVGVDNVAAVETFAQEAQRAYPRTSLRAACYKELAQRKTNLARARRSGEVAKEPVPASLGGLPVGKRGQ